MNDRATWMLSATGILPHRVRNQCRHRSGIGKVTGGSVLVRTLVTRRSSLFAGRDSQSEVRAAWRGEDGVNRSRNWSRSRACDLRFQNPAQFSSTVDLLPSRRLFRMEPRSMTVIGDNHPLAFQHERRKDSTEHAKKLFCYPAGKPPKKSNCRSTAVLAPTRVGPVPVRPISVCVRGSTGLTAWSYGCCAAPAAGVSSATRWMERAARPGRTARR